MTAFGERFSNLYNQTSEYLVEKLERGHEMYLYYHKQLIDINHRGVSTFFTLFLFVLFYFTVANTAAILIGKYDLTTYAWMILFIILVQVLGILAAINAIYLSESLICFVPQVSSSLSILSKRRARIGISKSYRFLRFYEIILNRKPFRFNFGPFGRMSKRSFLSFILLYIAELITAASSFIKNK